MLEGTGDRIRDRVTDALGDERPDRRSGRRCPKAPATRDHRRGLARRTLDAVRNAIIGYALPVVAMQSDDPLRLAAARKTLAPIDELRAAQATPASRPESTPAAPTTPTAAPENEGVTPDTPVPVVEDEPAASA